MGVHVSYLIIYDFTVTYSFYLSIIIQYTFLLYSFCLYLSYNLFDLAGAQGVCVGGGAAVVFLAALLWLFGPAQVSPYLLMGDGTDTLDTALGVDEEEDTPTLLEDSRCVLQHISVASNTRCHDDQLRR